METGVRTLAILVAVYPRSFDLQRFPLGVELAVDVVLPVLHLHERFAQLKAKDA